MQQGSDVGVESEATREGLVEEEAFEVCLEGGVKFV